MFENMMKYEKAWDKFVEWVYEEYIYSYEKSNGTFWSNISNESDQIYDDLILSIMPLFFKEQRIKFKCIIDLFDYDLEYLKLSCEKAFEILEEQLWRLNGNRIFKKII
jgi:hypothetical protein